MERFRERVIGIVAAVPTGRVVTYGQVALLAGAPRAARQVGAVLNGLREPEDLPWQRVINAEGRLSTYKIGAGELQKALLEAEGVVFDGDGRVDLRRFRWDPHPAELAAPQRTGQG
jgi:methylated-DNA-protein-cysteine methyltransferase-like protein